MALVVEDGTGKTDADSYQAIADVQTYLDDYGLSRVKWDAALTAGQEVAARVATRDFDALFEGRLRGVRKTADQALSHPRTSLVDDDGYLRSDTVLQKEVLEAHSLLAFASVEGDDLLKDEAAGANVTEKLSRVEGAVTSSKKFAGTASSSKLYRRVEAIMRPLILSQVQVRRA